tara:strand:- start:324 stop:545 length:222 start_codon:yes stop_codon:yes gene_type:complete
MEKNVRTKGKEMKDYTVGIWDLTFCLFDKDGNPLKDKDGNVKLYEKPYADFSDMAVGIDFEDLTEREGKSNDN